MRARIQREVEVAVPADRLWDYVTDWPRQAEWIPNTVVERVDDADHVGGRLRAWTGLGGPVPFGPGGSLRVSLGLARGSVARAAGPAGSAGTPGIGFWDPMTITSWERSADGGGRCEVLHRGTVVRGEGEFTVVALDEARSRFVWAEVVVLPLGRLGALGWPLVRPVVAWLVDQGLHVMRDRLEGSA